MDFAQANRNSTTTLDRTFPPAKASDMSLRDYFAAKVMQALVEETSVTAPDYFKAIATLAYSHADAMLVQREAKKE